MPELRRLSRDGRASGFFTAGLLTGLLALSGCGGSSGGSSHTDSTPATSATQGAPSSATGTANGAGQVTASAAGVTASMRATTHTPRVGVPWPLHFLVSGPAGAAQPASVSYEFLFAGQVVAHRSHYLFRGRFSDTVLWPASAVGYPLTFRAVVRAAASTLNLDYQVRVLA